MNLRMDWQEDKQKVYFKTMQEVWVYVTPHLWLKAEHLCYVLFPGSMIAPQNKI
jgi:hypothetical protein